MSPQDRQILRDFAYRAAIGAAIALSVLGVVAYPVSWIGFR